LASDTERAAALQSSKRAIETLETDCSELKRQLEELDRDEETRQATWHQTIAAANLPALSPAALRDWQALLPAARTACEALQSKLDEFEQVQATEQALASQLRAAIVATGLAMPAGEARLSTLSATASEVDAEIKQRETAITRPLANASNANGSSSRGPLAKTS
jgi:chromosome segregation ATPase